MRLYKHKSFLYIALYLVVMGAVVSLLYSRYETLTNVYTQSKVQEFDKRIESYQSMQLKDRLNQAY